MKILFTGGGTLGSVTPLLAVAEELKRSTIHDSRSTIIWVGTRRGPERKLVEDVGIKFFWIWTPKWRRYFDWRNFFVPLFLGFSVLWSLIFLLIYRPDALVTAGGFVAVPLVWAGRLLGIPSLLHNQDAHWSLANRLTALCVKSITYALPDTMPRSWEYKAIWTGNPVRSFILSGDKEKGLAICRRLSLRGAAEAQPPDLLPTILVIGGGTGAQRLNEIVVEALPELTKHYRVIHLTGKGKNTISNFQFPISNYCSFEFVGREMGDLYAAADIVITRAGMGALTELSALGKCMVIVPLPNTHQEENAAYFEKRGAAIALDQKTLTGEKLASIIKGLFDKIGIMQECAERAKEFSKPNAAKQVSEAIIRLAKK